MKKVSKKDLAFLEKLMAQYNDYSELVALNRNNNHDKETLQWNRGSLYCAKELMEDFVKVLGINLVYSFGAHPFLDRELKYQTVHLEGENTDYHRTKNCDFQVR